MDGFYQSFPILPWVMEVARTSEEFRLSSGAVSAFGAFAVLSDYQVMAPPLRCSPHLDRKAAAKKQNFYFADPIVSDRAMYPIIHGKHFLVIRSCQTRCFQRVLEERGAQVMLHHKKSPPKRGFRQ